jgi:hypothetical protein
VKHLVKDIGEGAVALLEELANELVIRCINPE